MRYFLKEQPAMALYDESGRPIPFTAIDRDYGFLSTENAYLIRQCEIAIAKHVGGVINSTEAEVENVKKKAESAQRSGQPQPRFVSSQTLAQLARAASPVADVARTPFGVNPNPIRRGVENQLAGVSSDPAPTQPHPLVVPILPRVSRNPV